eukprot:CAMPEP_0195146264 /NCGR_PEP_ID=MMETSP0448-20130528/171336_1 /TAXON_ID=66468 /ORGANISM="Heterocapsa triquestra, Strain CCMP 448" /LENGTH=75 /DNA_ID=CAMNT_0040184811 /DNA_START=30 /DNA_END=254 /DNA_ORIENTATION=+
MIVFIKHYTQEIISCLQTQVVDLQAQVLDTLRSMVDAEEEKVKFVEGKLKESLLNTVGSTIHGAGPLPCSAPLPV